MSHVAVHPDTTRLNSIDRDLCHADSKDPRLDEETSSVVLQVFPSPSPRHHKNDTQQV